MTSTFETVTEILSSLTDLGPEEIKLESHIGNDLDIDSLDFLDAIFEIDKTFDIQIPYEKWMEEVNQGGAPTEKYFVLKNLCEQIDQFVEAKAA